MDDHTQIRIKVIRKEHDGTLYNTSNHKLTGWTMTEAVHAMMTMRHDAVIPEHDDDSTTVIGRFKDELGRDVTVYFLGIR